MSRSLITLKIEIAPHTQYSTEVSRQHIDSRFMDQPRLFGTNEEGNRKRNCDLAEAREKPPEKKAKDGG